MKIYKLNKFDPVSLTEINKVLTEVATAYWLDQGSLLGYARNGEAIPWDLDIDLAMWDLPLNKKIEINEKLRQVFEYCYIDHVNNCIKVKFIDSTFDVYWSVDICFYKKNGNKAEKEWIDFYNNSKFVINIYEALCCMAGSNKKITNHFKKLVLSFLKVLPYSKKMAEHALLCLNNFVKKKRLSVNAFYFEQLSDAKFLGVTVGVPLKYTEYLEIKYGKGWMVPVVDWNYLTDDGALDSIGEQQ